MAKKEYLDYEGTKTTLTKIKEYIDKYDMLTVGSSNASFPVTFKSTTNNTSGVQENLSYNTSITINPYTGTLSATDFTVTSSRKLKENIKPTEVKALDLIGKIDVVDFTYIADGTKTPHVGFIAEDTDKLLSTPEMNKMDYTNCIGVLIKAVQELSEKNKELEDKIAFLLK